MILRNFTPFPHLVFESRDQQGRGFGVLVLRGTFEIQAGRALKPLPTQDPIVFADTYHGEPTKSSLRMENNLAPFKPRSDIHIDAVTYAPGGQPRPAWHASFELGSVHKKIAVTGPRFWKKGFPGWTLTDPIPVNQVALRYESAYGGAWEHGNKMDAFRGNPVGSGFVGDPERYEGKPIAAPTILPPEMPIPRMNVDMKAEGFGPISPGWHPRVNFAGTFDSVWQRTRWPNLPDNFRFDFYNSAHPDLIYPGYLKGDENVCLVNLTPGSGETRFWLPDYLVGMLFRFEDGHMVPAPMQLDTVHLDLIRMKAYLVWRGLYPVEKPMRVLEARMRQNASKLAPQKAAHS